MDKLTVDTMTEAEARRALRAIENLVRRTCMRDKAYDPVARNIEFYRRDEAGRMQWEYAEQLLTWITSAAHQDIMPKEPQP